VKNNQKDHELQYVEGAKALLFDRLVNLPETKLGYIPKKFFNRKELKESVRIELGYLLNSRCSYPERFLADDEELTVIDYGIPDLSHYSPQDPDHQKLIADIIEKAIVTFEPRLQNVKVYVQEFIFIKWALLIGIEADLVIGSFVEPVAFPLVFNNKLGAAEIYGNQ